MNISRLMPAVLLLAFVLTPTVALAQQGVGLAPNVPNFTGTQEGNNLVGAIRGIVNFLLAVVGIIAVVMLVIGGVRYIISQGDSDQTEQAKNTILYALIGLVVIGLSAVVVNFILTAVQNRG